MPELPEKKSGMKTKDGCQSMAAVLSLKKCSAI